MMVIAFPDGTSVPMMLAVVFLCGYIVGSIPFGLLIGKIKGVDIRQLGSKNVGATNVARVLGRKWGYLCFFLDMAKGLAPTLTACLNFNSPSLPTGGQTLWLTVALGCMLGHVFPVWLKFRGGKGVATALGVVLGVYPYFTFAGLAAFAVWIIVTLISRYVSLGSIVAAAAFLGFFIYFNFASLEKLLPLTIFASLIVLLIIVRHRANIRRLIAGQENKIGSKSRQ